MQCIFCQIKIEVESLNHVADLTVHLGYHGSTLSTAPNVAYL